MISPGPARNTLLFPLTCRASNPGIFVIGEFPPGEAPGGRDALSVKPIAGEKQREIYFTIGQKLNIGFGDLTAPRCQPVANLQIKLS